MRYVPPPSTTVSSSHPLCLASSTRRLYTYLPLSDRIFVFQLENIREIAVVLEEWVPPGEDGADEAAVLDEMDALVGQAALPPTIPEGQEEEQEASATTEGEGVTAESAQEGPKLPDYEELLPPAPVKEGADATAAGLNGDAAVGGVSVETAPAAGSDVPVVEETKGSPVPA